MQYSTFAAIDIGSYDVILEIFEISKKQGIRSVDKICHRMELGKDTYTLGKIRPEMEEELCRVLADFVRIMEGYRVDDYRATASSAISEASNSLYVLGKIHQLTGLSVTVLSNSEQRFLSYKALAAMEDNFNKIIEKGTAILDLDGGSFQISLFDKNNLVVTENIPIGAVRVRDYLALIGHKSGRLDEIMADYVDNDIVSFRNIYLKDKEIKNIIAVGEVVSSLKKIVPELSIKDVITRAQFDAMYKRVISMPAQELAEKYGIPYERATLMLPNITIYQSFLNNCKAEEMYVPDVDFCECIVANYMDEGSRVVFNHNFEEDILATANNIAKRYRCNRNHVEQTAYFALKIFDVVRKPFGLDKMQRLQLQIAALLHECGNFINLHDGARNSYYIVANTEILGLSHKERMEVANVVKYNPLYLPSKDKISAELDGCDYIVIAKLAAILRIANILDKSHMQKIEDISVTLKDGKLIILAKTYEDISLEAGLFEARADFFEQIYGIRPVLRVKRSV